MCLREVQQRLRASLLLIVAHPGALSLVPGLAEGWSCQSRTWFP